MPNSIFFQRHNGNGKHSSWSRKLQMWALKTPVYDMNEEGDNCCDQSFFVVVTNRRQAHMQIILID